MEAPAVLGAVAGADRAAMASHYLALARQYVALAKVLADAVVKEEEAVVEGEEVDECVVVSSQEEAEEVHSSEYGTLLQRVRTPGVIGKSGTSPGRDRSSRISQEEIRLDSNSPVSPSSDLLGGSPKQAWTEPALELS